MDYPPMFGVYNFDIWNVRMSWHLKAIGFKVYLAITKESYLSNNKHLAVSYTHLTLPTKRIV